MLRERGSVGEVGDLGFLRRNVRVHRNLFGGGGMNPIEKIQLWRCPECGEHYQREGLCICSAAPDDLARTSIDTSPVTYVPLDQVLEVIEGAAKEADELPDNRDEAVALAHIEHAEHFRRLASQLKGSGE